MSVNNALEPAVSPLPVAEAVPVPASPVFAPGFSRSFDLRHVAILLGRSYSAAQMLEAQAALAHITRADASIRLSRNGSTIRPLRQGIQTTRLIDALNRGRKWARQRLAGRLASMLTDGVVLAVVPSHDPWLQETPIRLLAREVAVQGDFADATSCLVRHTKIQRIVFGGPSHKALHRKTIRVENAERIQGKSVLLLDDIAKSGQSLAACRSLLYEAGAVAVQAMALGRVTREPVTPLLS